MDGFNIILDSCMLIMGLAAYFTSIEKLKNIIPGNTKADEIKRRQYKKYTYIGVVLYFTIRLATYFLL